MVWDVEPRAVRDGLALEGRKAKIMVTYPWDGVVNGFDLIGNDTSLRGLVFINTNPLTAYQRDITGFTHNNGDLIRVGGQTAGGPGGRDRDR